MNVSNLKHNHGHEVADSAKKLNPRHSSELKNDNDHSQKPAKVATDRVFLNNIRPEQAREFLHNHIGQSIAAFASAGAPRSASAQPAFARSFPTAEATASHIIDNVSQAAGAIPTGTIKTNGIDSGESTGEDSTVDTSITDAPESGSNLSDLINKIQDGFHQAKDALEQLGALTPSFALEFEEIQQKVNDFLVFLEDPENNVAPTSPNKIETNEVAASHESYQSSSQASIQIETRDGDIVTIDLSNSFNQEQTAAASQSVNSSGNFSGYVYEAYSERANSFSFTVSGDLDDDELNAISALVGDIGQTVGQFEKGNVNAALNIAKNIDRQSDELSGFSFNVQTSEQYRAIDLYQKTQVTTADPLPVPDASSPAIPTPENSPVSAPNENIESIFSNNISNHIYAAESANILDAAATVNSIFEKFYEQLSALNERFENLIASENEEHNNGHEEELHP